MSIFDPPNLYSFKAQYDVLKGTPNYERFGKIDLASFGDREMSKEEQKAALEWLAERGVTDIKFSTTYKRGIFDPPNDNKMNVLAWPFRNIGTQIEASMTGEFWRPTSVQGMRGKAREESGHADFLQHGGPYTLDPRDFNESVSPDELERAIDDVYELNAKKYGSK